MPRPPKTSLPTTPKSAKPRKAYRAPGSVVRTVRLYKDIPVRSKGHRTGGVKLWAASYAHIAALFGWDDEKDVYTAVREGRFNPDYLCSIIAFAAADPARLAAIRERAEALGVPPKLPVRKKRGVAAPEPPAGLVRLR